MADSPKPAFTLADATVAKVNPFPFSLIYGREGSGKTSLALQMPDPFLIRFGGESVPEGYEVPSVLIRDLDHFGEVYRALATEKHSFRTVVVDSLSRAVPMVNAWVVANVKTDKGQKVANLEDYGYGKGYFHQAAAFDEHILRRLRYLNMAKSLAVTCIMHATVKRHEDPTSTAFDRWIPDLHEKSLAIFERDADAEFFLHAHIVTSEEKEGFGQTRTRATAGIKFIHTSGTPAFNAKSRYNLPERVLYEQHQGYQALVDAGFPYWGVVQETAAA